MSQLKKYSKNQALKKIRELLKSHCDVLFTGHAIQELKNDGLDRTDALNVLHTESARITDEPELINDSWRYRIGTNAIIVVVAFMINSKGLIVITVFKIKSRRYL